LLTEKTQTLPGEQRLRASLQERQAVQKASGRADGKTRRQGGQIEQ